MKLLLPLSLALAHSSAFAQTKLNLPLRRVLNSMLVQDQKYRELLMSAHNGTGRSMEKTLHLAEGQLFTYALTNMQRVDSSNLRRVEAIVRRYGYPGKSLVGTPANEAVWCVIQHSPKIAQYLPLIRTAAEKQEIPFSLYAKMLDRQLMDEGHEQLYGTQGATFNILNKATGQRETTGFIWPIKDAAHVNERRKQAGFSNSVEANSVELGIPYKPVSLEFAKQMQAQSRANH